MLLVTHLINYAFHTKEAAFSKNSEPRTPHMLTAQNSLHEHVPKINSAWLRGLPQCWRSRVRWRARREGGACHTRGTRSNLGARSRGRARRSDSWRSGGSAPCNRPGCGCLARQHSTHPWHPRRSCPPIVVVVRCCCCYGGGGLLLLLLILVAAVFSGSLVSTTRGKERPCGKYSHSKYKQATLVVHPQ